MPRPDPPPVLLGTEGDVNLIAYGGNVYAALQTLGPIDLDDPVQRRQTGVLEFADLEEARRQLVTAPTDASANPLYTSTPLDVFALPEVIDIELTHTCNLRCVMCHVSYENLSKQMLDPAFLRRLGGLEGKWVKLGSMYEPMAHPRFAEIVTDLSRLGMKIDLITNGTLLTPRLIDRIASGNFYNVTISFDGIRRETFERIRRRADFDETLKRVDAFVAALRRRNPRVLMAISYTILRSNIDEIAEAVDFWEARGFDHIGFISMVTRDNNETLKAETIEPVVGQVAAAIDEAARRVIQKGYRITMTSPLLRTSKLRDDFPRCFLAGAGLVRSAHSRARTPTTPSNYFQDGDFPGVHVSCRSPFKLARINYDGQVQLCNQFAVGSIYERDLLDIWRGAAASKVRGAVTKSPEVCHGCDYYKFCIRANNVDLSDPASFVANKGLVLVETRWPYNLLDAAGVKFAAVPQFAGELNPLIDDVRAAGGYEAPTLEDLRAQIDEAFRKQRRPGFVETVRMFDVYAWHRTFYAVPHWVHPKWIGRLKERNPGIITDGSLDALKQRILSPKVPLLVSIYGKYNIVQKEDQYTSVRMGVGKVADAFGPKRRPSASIEDVVNQLPGEFLPYRRSTLWLCRRNLVQAFRRLLGRS